MMMKLQILEMNCPWKASRILTLLLAIIAIFGTAHVNAQSSIKKKDDQLKVPEPEELTLETGDKVQLKCTYFAAPSGEEGKPADVNTAVPMILLHDWDGDRSQLRDLALFFQSAGRAVIVPDLRGHGASLSVTGFDKKLDYKRFRKNEIMSVQKDIERCKKYLVKRNNEGKVNIDLLTVLAVGETSALAVQWSINNWFAFPAKNADGIKQGQDVKALILVSPKKRMDRMTLADQFKSDLFNGKNVSPLPMMVLWGRGEKSAKDAEYLCDRLEKSRPDLSEIDDKEEREQKKSLYRVPVKQGSGVEFTSANKVKGLWAYINRFVENKIAAKAGDHPWESREKKK